MAKKIHVVLLESERPIELTDAPRGANVLVYEVEDDKLRIILAALKEASG